MILQDARKERFAQQMASGKQTKKAAAIAAGWAPSIAGPTASRLVKEPEVLARISELTVKISEIATLSAARVLEEIKRLALVDMRGFFDEKGNLKPIHELTEEQGACLAGFEVIKKNAEAGDGIIDTVHKFKVWDKTKALEMLAKYFGLLTEKVEISGNINVDLFDRLAAGRKRLIADREPAH